VYFFVHLRYSRLFTDQNYQALFQGSFQRATSDPCQFQFQGDPSTPSLSYIKINFHCAPDIRPSKNTLNLTPSTPSTFAPFIQYFSRLVGLDPNIVLSPGSDWICFQNQKQIVSPDTAIVPNATIDCLRPPLTYDNIRP